MTSCRLCSPLQYRLRDSQAAKLDLSTGLTALKGSMVSTESMASKGEANLWLLYLPDVLYPDYDQLLCPDD